MNCTAMRSSVTVADVQGNTGAVYSIEDVRHASDPAFVSEPLPRRSFGSF